MRLLFRLPWTNAAGDPMYDLVSENVARVRPRGNFSPSLTSFELDRKSPALPHAHWPNFAC